MQTSYSNSNLRKGHGQTGFPRVSAGAGSPGLDLVIGQSPNPRPDIHCPAQRGGSTMTTTTASPQAVTMKGGEYFFMPSLSFFRSLP